MEKNTGIQKLMDDINAPSREFEKLLQPIKTMQDSMKSITCLQEIGNTFKSMPKLMNSLPYNLLHIQTISPFAEILANQQKMIDRITGTVNCIKANNINLVSGDFFDKLTELHKNIEILEKDREEYEKNYFGQLADEELKEKEEVIARLEEEKEEEKLKYEEEKKVWERQCTELNFLKKIAGEAILIAQKSQKETGGKWVTGNNNMHTLKPCLEPEQIMYLYDSLSWLFDATVNQWQNLFAEQIKETQKPIILKGNISDLVNFFELLKENGYVDTNTYASIIENKKLFTSQSGMLTSLKIRQAKRNIKKYNFGDVKYGDIEEVVACLKTLNTTLHNKNRCRGL